MKKIKSINELMWKEFFLWFICSIILTTLHLLFYRLIFIIISFIITIVYLVRFIYLSYNFKKVWNQNLPLKCIRNPFGYIEIHIGKKCNNDLVAFLNGCLETILIAKNEKRDIIADTWLISEKNIF